MGLITNVLIVAIIAIVILVAARSIAGTAPQQVTSAQASAEVKDFITSSFSGSTVNVTTNITPSNYQGSWHIVAQAIINGTKVCPSYYIYSFDYPRFTLVNNTENLYTSNCVVGGIQPNLPYMISSYPVAIAMSYDAHIPKVEAFISRYGRNAVDVYANYFRSIALNGTNYTKAWIINYTMPSASHYVVVVLNQTVVQDRINGTEVPAFNYS